MAENGDRGNFMFNTAHIKYAYSFYGTLLSEGERNIRKLILKSSYQREAFI